MMVVEAREEKLSFQAEVKQLLDIVVHSLYSNKEIFLRELISNASDAIDKLRFRALSDPLLYENDSELRIHLLYDKEAKTLTIRDNGIGMTREEIIGNLGTIAKSGTREFLSRLTGEQKKDSHLIGQFGVGFYSAFIVANKVTVISRAAGLGQEHGVIWESAGDGEYTVSNIEKESRGTDIILHLKDDETEFLEPWRLKNIITKYSDHINIPILMKKLGENDVATNEFETVNKATALWTLPKNTIKEEEYQEFYKHIAHDFEAPLAYTHHKIEGNLDYTCVLYLPKNAPFDLWHRDAHHGLKLYVQRVFIMDQVEQFLPHYLRFVRGVLDTTALPLNISREILQDHHTIPKLKNALTKHVLDMLERTATNEPEKYTLFWQEFGNVLKEGPAEDFANRDRVGTLLRFASTKSNDALISLNDYVTRMKENQKKIYYITADSMSAAKASPHLEIFYKNDIEVLLLVDRIDEWVVSHLPSFDGKELQSVAKGDLPLAEIDADANDNTEAKQKEQEAQQADFAELLKKMQTSLSDHVKEVRLSHRLTNSPACLVRDQHSLGPQMERLLKATGQAVTEVKPILEINPNHAIIAKLRDELDMEKVSDWTHILYGEALLSEGSALPDPAEFVQKINQLWITSL